MTDHVFLIDVTRHKGPTQSLISSARAHIAAYAQSKVECICLAQQAGEFGSLGTAAVVAFDGSAKYISTRVREMASNGSAGATFHVMSYDGVVLRAAAALNGPELVITSTNLAVLSHANVLREMSSRDPVVPVVRPTEELIPLDEAVELTKSILSRGGHTSRSCPLLQMKLRTLLAKEDVRAKKNPRDIRSLHLIKNIVELGLKGNWLESDRLNGKSGSEAIWLRTDQQPAVVLASAPVLAAEPAPSPPLEVGEARTKEMIQCLKNKGFYCPKDVRDLLCKQVQLLLGSDMPVARVFRNASQHAAQQAEQEGIRFDGWHAATQALMNTMLATGVLKNSDGARIPAGLTSRGAPLASLEPDFMDTCECFLFS